MNFSKRIMLLALLAAILLSTPVFADGIIIPRPLPDRPVPPYLTIKYHRVKVSINNQVATTTVDQVFVNEMNRDLEGEYIFPLPEDAAISSFKMEVDGKMVEGKVLEKEEARRIYESIVRRRKDPALLEYIGRNMFRARVYPIPAKGTKRIQLTYSETLKADNGVVKYLYPLNTEKFSPRPLQDCSVVVRIKSGVPIKSVYSPSHKMGVTRKSDNYATASWEKTNYKPTKDVVLYYTLSKKDFGLNLLTYREKGDKTGYFMMFLAPKEKTDKKKVIPKDVVFVLDKSGSMDDKGKMENAKKALKFCLSNLNKQDRFNVIAFSDEVKPLHKSLISANQENIKMARSFVEDTSPMGGTNIHEALLTALDSYKGSENTPYLIFLTDGLPTVGETNVNKIVTAVKQSNKRKVRIFTFGVGYDVNTRLLDDLANDHRGYPEYIKPGENMEVKISSFFRKIAEPLLSDVHLSIPGVKIESMYPRQLPDIFKGSQLIVVGRYRGSGPSVVKLTGRMGADKFSNTYEGNFPEVSEKNDFIPRLWAIRRIGYLLEAIRRKGKNTELVNEVVRLSTKYGIITPYTSFLVTEPKDGDVDDHRPAPKPVYRSMPSGAGGVKKKSIFGAKQEAESGEESVQTSQDIANYKQAKSPVPESKKVKNVKGKSFFLRNGIWTDSEYKGTEKIINVKFGSDEYFELVKDKKLARYLSIGSKVLVKYKGKVYLVKP